MPQTLRSAFATLLLLAGLCVPALGAAITVSGQVTYRERIPLPPGAVLTVALIDPSTNPPRTIVEAEAPIENPGHVPLQFVLDYPSSVVSADRRLGLFATISAGGKVLFQSRTPFLLDPIIGAAPLLIVEYVPPGAASPELPAPPAANSGGLEIAPGLLETVWEAVLVAGAPVGRIVTLRIAADRRAGGQGGCNDYFTEAVFDGAGLSFTPVATTRRACPSLVRIAEQTFFAALALVSGYALEGDRLALTDDEGALIIMRRAE